MTGHAPQAGSLVKIHDLVHVGTGTNRRHIGGEYMTVTATTTDKHGNLALQLSHSHDVGDEDIWLHATDVDEVGRWT